ncbi:MAG: multidrug effflux MFS transporter [Pseudorhodoplanes sp.]|nr:multidrug effflux MFS transporter [Pseudorhodoplanes sp.]
MDAPAPVETTTPAPPRWPWKFLILLMAMSTIGPLALNIILPAVPNLVRTMQTDAGTVQLTMSLFVLGLAVSQLALGPLSDRFGRRPVTIAGLGITAVASVAALAATSIEALIVARTIQALGASTGLVISRAMIRDLYDRDRSASLIGAVATVMVAAPMVAPMIGGLLDIAFGWKSIFLFVALATCGVLAWAIAALPETRPDHVTGGGVRYLLGEARALLKDRNFVGYVLQSSLGTATFFAFIGGAPHLVIGVMGVSSAQFGFWFMLTAFGYMVGNLLAARLSDRLGIHRMILIGMSIQMFGALLLVAAALLFPEGGPLSIFPLQFFVSCGNGMFLPNATAGAISVRPRAAGTASGLTGFAQMGAGAIAVQAMSYLATAAPTALPMALVMLALVAAAALTFVGLVRK